MDGCFLYYIDRESSPSVEYVDPPPAETGAKRREEEEEERELARLYVDEKCIASVLSVDISAAPAAGWAEMRRDSFWHSYAEEGSNRVGGVPSRTGLPGCRQFTSWT